MTAFYSFTSF